MGELFSASELRMGLGENLGHDVVVGFVSFVSAAEFKVEPSGGGDDMDLASFEDHPLVNAGNANDLVVGDGDHRFVLNKHALVEEDQAAVCQADKASACAFAIEDRGESLTLDEVGDDAIKLAFIVIVWLRGGGMGHN